MGLFRALSFFLFVVSSVSLYSRAAGEEMSSGMEGSRLDIMGEVGSLPQEGERGIISFEASRIPENWRTLGKSSLAISKKHYKGGEQSLLWNFREGSPLIALKPGGITFSADAERGGIKGWIYNETPLNRKIHFNFGSVSELENRNPKYAFEFGLNFRGWRAFWVDFKRDGATENAREGALEAMLIYPPKDVERGQLYLDFIEFADIEWHRTADYQVPVIRATLDVELGGRTWERSYFWSQKEPTEPLPDKITREEVEAFRLIDERYKKWVYGGDASLDSPAVRIRGKSFQKWIATGVEAFDKIEINKKDGKVVSGTPLFAHKTNRRPRFGKDTAEKMFLQLALDYKLNGNTESKQKALDLFDHFHDQGWAEGSANGTLDHEGNRLVGWVHAVYLMKDELKAAGKLERELASMNWYLDFGETFEAELSTEVTSDNMRTYLQFRLLRVLAMDDSPKKVQYMRGYLNWANSVLDIQPGYSGGIKPDYTVYHHRHAYYGAYGPQALHNSAAVAWLLSGTQFALSDGVINNVKQALLTFRNMANKYDVPKSGLLGRFPNNSTRLNRTLPAFAYIALASDPVDEEMAAAFMRLYDLEAEAVRDDLLTRVASRIMFYDTLGAAVLMDELAGMGFEAEKLDAGHWVKPYANLSIHRRDNWLVSVKGWSQYVWDFESSGKENIFGRYDSHGAIQILANGSPVSVGESGYDFRNGWDWNRNPGTTTIHLPWEELKHRPDIKTELQPESAHRNFTDQTFVGGVSLEGRNGMFAMKFHDPFFSPGFRANRSVFFFDNEIICLASDIENNEGGYNTETTLFQVALKDVGSPMWVDSLEPVTEFPYKNYLDSRSIWLMDPVGNGYVIPNGGVNLFRHEQQSRDDRNRKDTRGNYALALINHGKAPDSEAYEYAILVQSTPEKVKAYSEDIPYSVLQKNRDAHIVKHNRLDITGYAIFNEKKELGHGSIREVSAPVMIMAREAGSSLVLSLSDPDFRRLKQRNSSSMPNKIVMDPSQSMKVRITVEGGWNLNKAYRDVRIVGSDKGGTVIEFDCVDARTYEIELSPS